MTALTLFGHRCKAVIFDMDGVVIDSEGSYMAAWQRAAERLNYNGYQKLFEQFRGLEYAAIEKKLLCEISADFPLREFAGISAEIWHEQVASHGMPVLPGFHAMYASLQAHRVPVALATNSHLHNARNCLQLAGLERHFPVIATADQVARGKPDPAIFLLAAEKLGMQPEECLVIEDTLHGLKAARLAGMVSVYLAALVSRSASRAIAADFNTVYSYGELQEEISIVSG